MIEQSASINLWFFPDLREFNPYQTLLYSSISNVCHPGIPRRSDKVKNKQNILHLHWEHFVYRGCSSPLVANSRVLDFIEYLFELQRADWIIYWTIHNLEPHENYYPGAHALLQNHLAKLSDLIFCHSERSVKIASNLFPSAMGKLRIVHHPSYRSYYNIQARDVSFGFESKFNNKLTFLFFGSCREYKGIDILITAFIRAARINRNISLVIAGEGPTMVFDREILSNSTIPSELIFIIRRRIEDHEVSSLLKAVDVLVLPYKRVFTSGAFVLGRDFNLPMVFPEEFLEFQDCTEQAEVFTFRACDVDDLADCLLSVSQDSLSSLRHHIFPLPEPQETRLTLAHVQSYSAPNFGHTPSTTSPKKTKTLVCILHFEREDLTRRLYESLVQEQDESFTVKIIDNGSSTPINLPGVRLNQNVLFGGGLNVAFNLVANESEYDSLLFLNNDLIVNGSAFVQTLKRKLSGNFKIISPCIIQPSDSQCFWPTMWNWGSDSIREVPWVDFMAPMFHRDFIMEIGSFSEALKYGWGNDVYSGIVCKERNWLVGVVDSCVAVHLGSQTIKSHGAADYKIKAKQEMIRFFWEEGLFDQLVDYRRLARQYKFHS